MCMLFIHYNHLFVSYLLAIRSRRSSCQQSLLVAKFSIFYCFCFQWTLLAPANPNCFLILISHIIQLYRYLFNTNRFEYFACVCRHIGGIDIFRYFELDCTNVHVTAQRPEMWLLHTVHARQSGDFLIALRQYAIDTGRLTLHQHRHRFLYQTNYTQCNQNCNENRANRIGTHPPE